MVATLNSCLCALLYKGQVCIACRIRIRNFEQGETCYKCGIGLMADEHFRKMCAECYYVVDLEE